MKSWLTTKRGEIYLCLKLESTSASQFFVKPCLCSSRKQLHTCASQKQLSLSATFTNARKIETANYYLSEGQNYILIFLQGVYFFPQFFFCFFYSCGLYIFTRSYYSSLPFPLSSQTLHFLLRNFFKNITTVGKSSQPSSFRVQKLWRVTIFYFS